MPRHTPGMLPKLLPRDHGSQKDSGWPIRKVGHDKMSKVTINNRLRAFNYRQRPDFFQGAVFLSANIIIELIVEAVYFNKKD